MIKLSKASPLSFSFILHPSLGDLFKVSLPLRNWASSVLDIFFIWCALCFVTQSCLTLCDPMDCSPAGSSVHGILQARILEWVAMPSTRGSSQPRDRTLVSRTAGKFFTAWASRDIQGLFICNGLKICISIPDLFQEFPLPTPWLHLECLKSRLKWNYFPSPTCAKPTPPLVPFNRKWFHHPIPLRYLCPTFIFFF